MAYLAVARRLTIGTLMAVVSLVAADFGIVRALWDINGPQAGVAIVTLPMIDLLLLTMPRLRRGNSTRPFWGGFQAVGWIMVLMFGLLAWYLPDTFFWPIDAWDRMHLIPDPAADMALLISIAVVLYTTPQLLLALVAARLSAKYRIVIERR
jgi:hypothetical protein